MITFVTASSRHNCNGCSCAINPLAAQKSSMKEARRANSSSSFFRIMDSVTGTLIGILPQKWKNHLQTFHSPAFFAQTLKSEVNVAHLPPPSVPSRPQDPQDPASFFHLVARL